MKKIVLFIAVSFWGNLFLHGQKADYQIHYKIANNQVWVRWEPKSLPAFQHAVNGNMTLEVYQVSGTITDPQFRQITQQPAQPLDINEWKNNLTASTWDTIAVTCVYGDQLDKAFLNETFLADEYGDSKEEAWNNRFQAYNFFIRNDWSAIQRSGMGHSWNIDNGAGTYVVKLFPTPSGDTLALDINVPEYAAPAIPELKAVYKDRWIELEWRTLEYRADFFAWTLERSNDAGQSWQQMFDPYIMNIHDTLERESDALKSLSHKDYLRENEEDVIYRLRGKDYLGGVSERSSLVSKEGHEDITLSPQITQTIQTDSNYAVIQWEYDVKFNRLLKEFRIVATDTTGKNYRTVMDGIDPSAREVAVFMKFRSNFYRVQAVSKLGTVLSSFESLVMMFDADPPAVPGNFTGYIDSTGLTHLNWVTSNEEDLAGYYLFKGYFKDGELAMITPDPLSGPNHTDTIDMETGNEWVYYKLRSVDTRGNGSAFTPLLALKKPDIYPPAAPRIVEAKSNIHSINLRWTTSPSPDVEEYRLYRKVMDEDMDWTQVLSFNKDEFYDTYIDSLVETGKAYAYTMQVTDDDGLDSEFCQPVSRRLKDYGIRSPIESFTAQADTSIRSIVLQWIYDQSPREYYLYRGQNEKPMALLKVISGDKIEYRDTHLKAGETYKYVLRAVFPNGTVSPFTPILEVTLE